MKRRRGLYRFTFPGGVECARTHALAGDASPFLDRATYEALSFEPAFDALPTREEYLAANPVEPRGYMKQQLGFTDEQLARLRETMLD